MILHMTTCIHHVSHQDLLDIGQNNHHFDQFWEPSYLTSKLMSLFVNLIVSSYILTHDLLLKPRQPVTGYFFSEVCQINEIKIIYLLNQ